MKREYLLLVVLTVVAGLIGGAVSNWVAEAVPAPDEERILFARGQDMFIMDADGGNLRQVDEREVAGVLGFGKAGISPDGEQIVRGGSNGIYIMNVDGSNAKQLTNERDLSPSWSPDGQRIAFTSKRDGNSHTRSW